MQSFEPPLSHLFPFALLMVIGVTGLENSKAVDRAERDKFQLPVLKITTLCNDQEIAPGNDDVLFRPALAEPPE